MIWKSNHHFRKLIQNTTRKPKIEHIQINCSKITKNATQIRPYCIVICEREPHNEDASRIRTISN